MNIDTTDLDAMWADYRSTRSDAARNAIAERYMKLVHYRASQMADRLSDKAELDDLVSFGSVGLIKAIKTFDRSRGVKFKTWAETKISCEILDRLRDACDSSRLHRIRYKAVGKFCEQFRQAESREPSPEEIEAACGRKAVRDAEKVTKLKRRRSLQSIAGVTEYGDNYALASTLSCTPELDSTIKMEAAEVMSYAASNLTLTEAITLKFYFYEGWTMRRISRELTHRSESSVSYMIGVACRKLREVA